MCLTVDSSGALGLMDSYAWLSQLRIVFMEVHVFRSTANGTRHDALIGIVIIAASRNPP